MIRLFSFVFLIIRRLACHTDVKVQPVEHEFKVIMSKADLWNKRYRHKTVPAAESYSLKI